MTSKSPSKENAEKVVAHLQIQHHLPFLAVRPRIILQLVVSSNLLPITKNWNRWSRFNSGFSGLITVHLGQSCLILVIDWSTLVTINDSYRATTCYYWLRIVITTLHPLLPGLATEPSGTEVEVWDSLAAWLGESQLELLFSKTGCYQ